MLLAMLDAAGIGVDFDNASVFGMGAANAKD